MKNTYRKWQYCNTVVKHCAINMLNRYLLFYDEAVAYQWTDSSKPLLMCVSRYCWSYCDTSCLPSPWEPGSLVFQEGGDAVSDCRFLWSAVTQRIPRERVTKGGVERGLKCSARYSKRCLINNVSERTSWDTAGPLCLSQAPTHAPPSHTQTRIWEEADQSHPSSSDSSSQISSRYSDTEAAGGNTCISSLLMNPLSCWILVCSYMYMLIAQSHSNYRNWGTLFLWALFPLHEFS